MTPNEHRIFLLLRDAAVAGDACPSNALERDGHIIVQRYMTARIVTICGTGHATAVAGALVERAHTSRARPAIREIAPAVRPCSGCGIRTDIGCSCPPRPFAGLTIISRRMLEGLPA